MIYEPQTAHFAITAGDDVSVGYGIKTKADGAVADLSTATSAKFNARLRGSNANAFGSDKTCTTQAAADGVNLIIVLSSTDTGSLAAGKYDFEVELTIATKVETVVKGTISVADSFVGVVGA